MSRLVPIGSKGQEEAPFSLLLAVAMMAMVIPIAVYMFQGFQAWECEQRIENNMHTFARELELSATLGGGRRITDIDLSLSGCHGFSIESFKLEFPGPQNCQDMCHDPNCRILSAIIPEYDDITGEKTGDYTIATQPVCVRIPLSVTFTTEGCDPDLNEENIGVDGESSFLNPKYYRLSLTKEGRTVRLCQIVMGGRV